MATGTLPAFYRCVKIRAFHLVLEGGMAVQTQLSLCAGLQLEFIVGLGGSGNNHQEAEKNSENDFMSRIHILSFHRFSTT